MNGEPLIYRHYKKSQTSRITIPKSIARSLNWKDKDAIHVEYMVKQNKNGIFIFKNSGGDIVKYNSRISTITIPISIARALHWKDQDHIFLEFKTAHKVKGLFLYKK